MSRILCVALFTLSPLHGSLAFSQDEATSKLSSKADSTGSTSSKDDSSKSDSAKASTEPMLTYFAPVSYEMLIGIKITPVDGNLISTQAQTVFPTDWPEQKVTIVESNLPNGVRQNWRELPGKNKQLLLFVPLVTPSDPIEATIKVRIEKSHIKGPIDNTKLAIPKRPPNTIKNMYLGRSPYIDPGVAEIKKIVKTISDAEPLTDWKHVELFYDWVRDNIAYENGDLKKTSQTLKDRKGDCEDLTSVFVALCRAAHIPARCVWIPGHCYPEFYLEDENGEGYWFPCQVAGTRNFGNMPEYLPILQKGDQFKVPEQKEVMRYVQDYLKSEKNLGRRDPRVEFVRQLLGEAANFRSPDLQGAANSGTSNDAKQ